MLGDLHQFDLSQVHQRVDFVARAFEVFDAEGVDCYDLDAGFVADLQYLRTTKKKIPSAHIPVSSLDRGS